MLMSGMKCTSYHSHHPIKYYQSLIWSREIKSLNFRLDFVPLVTNFLTSSRCWPIHSLSFCCVCPM
jgi:hypothetical protein